MNSTAREWLRIRRSEGHHLCSGTAAQVERLHILTSGGARPPTPSHSRAAPRESSRRATPPAFAHGAAQSTSAARSCGAGTTVAQAECAGRDGVVKAEAEARLALLCALLHWTACRRCPTYAVDGGGGVADDRSTASSHTPRRLVPLPSPPSRAPR
ncbi:hypothetical protein NESM_000722300 [Novymonas esmeraldas]|uniref:Uncharacterized protein n=1 Tax=Novymonas esmeraldas TaxID=1808958 RepID=A0AAW0EY22_9TRYP